MGSDDIYEVLIFDFIITVNLRDAQTKELIEGNIEVRRDNSNLFVKTGTDVSSVKFPAMEGDKFNSQGTSAGYLPGKIDFEAKNLSRETKHQEYSIYLERPISKRTVVFRVEINGTWVQTMYELDNSLSLHVGTYENLMQQFEKDRIAVDSVIDLRNVLYDFDKSNIRGDAEQELNKWVMFLKMFPQEKVLLAAHTDTRGSKKYNTKLAQRRVESARKYLVKAGISKDRIKETSYGKDKVFFECDACDENQHQGNRRTEITILRD
jgi:outer membrane protein OmpA-like peptidoglycan-associated protein